jgi:flavin reductase (DIM6/NTAB) family NADH-FMN oxidoreductase RutF
MALRPRALSKVYQLLEPSAVVLLTTEARGHANVMTMSWHMMLEFGPPLVGCVVSEANFSFAALRATKEAVIAIPAHGLAETVVGIGNCSGRDTDKFARFGLTRLPARKIRPPLIAECFCNLECRVTDTRMVKRYDLFVLEIVQAWINPAQKSPRTLHHRGYGSFAVDGTIIRLRSRKK